MAGPANAALRLEDGYQTGSRTDYHICWLPMIICNGQNPGPLTRLQTGAKHTLFTAMQSPHTARKQWIAGSLTLRAKSALMMAL